VRLADGDRTTVTRNTHAIAWLDGHVRNPTPRKVIWDLTTRATSRRRVAFRPTGNRSDLHYWLDLAGQGATPSSKLIIARLDKATNTVVIETCGDSLRVLLKHGMLDLARPVRVEVGGRNFQVSPQANREILLRTMIDRGDPNFMFEASITIQEKERRLDGHRPIAGRETEQSSPWERFPTGKIAWFGFGYLGSPTRKATAKLFSAGEIGGLACRLFSMMMRKFR
jgi:hypothetical protein